LSLVLANEVAAKERGEKRMVKPFLQIWRFHVAGYGTQGIATGSRVHP
jgi:hypothetical protein